MDASTSRLTTCRWLSADHRPRESAKDRGCIDVTFRSHAPEPIHNPYPPNLRGHWSMAARLFDVRGAGCSVADSCRCWYLCAGRPLRQYLVGTFGSSLAVSFRCRLAGTLAGRAGSCLAGGAGRVLAWRVNGTTGQALRNADPAERQLPFAQPGSWCVLPHRPCNRNRALCFLAVSDRQLAG